MGVCKRLIVSALSVLLALAVSVSSAEFTAASSDSAKASGTVPLTVAMPRADHISGTYTENIYVKLTCSTSGARIFYTTDGSYPGIHSNEYINPIRIRGVKGESNTTLLRAVAVKTGYETSDVAEYIYTIERPLEPSVEYMEIRKLPNKVKYRKGEDLNLTGGTIIVSYADGTFATLDMTESMISGFNTNTAGQKEITVSYGGYSDHFTITVTGSSSNSGDDYEYNEEDEQEDLRPQLSGTTIRGWKSIEKAFAESTPASSRIIMLNDAVTVPADVIRAAANNKLKLTFMVDSDFKWTLDTSAIDTATIPAIGLGLRTSPITMLQTAINAVGGTEVQRIHINSKNKLNAALCLDLGLANKNKIASLFCYDTDNDTLRLTDTCVVDVWGNVMFIPDVGGDYIVICDDETKIIGDLDNNMRIDAFDAAMLIRMVVNGEEENRKNDFDKNGVLNALDVSAMLKYIVNNQIK